MKLDPEDVEDLEEELRKYDGMAHLWIKKRGASLVIYSGNPKDPQKHARLTLLSEETFTEEQSWGLSLPGHTGRWKQTPFIGTMEDIVGTLVDSLGAYLEIVQSL